ncbi:hypothetical protein [Planctomycetes bacterium TBK1r]|uniref:Uncharacterized protein n=1 Tax=Stieleria magnilauensis TaxID=2527963 RepID=A0ABX5XIP3_9BACT|nr:hypothetical protein TBK1r_01600 [Planctomycetes bacterium TBK1r]
MTDIQIRNIDPEHVQQLEELASEQGQPFDTFVVSLLVEILHKRRVEREKGLGSRIAKRFENLGLEEGKLEELRGHPVTPPELGQ